MKPTSIRPATCLYAIRLLNPDAAGTGGIVGRLEHVLSGRQHRFHSGAALLAFLVLEQSRGSCADEPSAPPSLSNDGPRTD